MPVFQFDPFRFDAEQGTLSGPSGDTYLRPKTAQLLQYLLNHPEQMVSKQALFDHLWPDSVVTEHTLSQSIKDLRQALADDAKNPRFIKTLPKRGFQWLVEVSVEVKVEADVVESVPTKITTSQDTPPYQSRSKKPLMLALLVLAVVVATFIANHLLYINQSPEALPSTKHSAQNLSTVRVTLLPVVNATGEPQMDWVQLGLWDMLLNALARHQNIEVISQTTIQQRLQTEKTTTGFNSSQLNAFNDSFDATITMQLILKRIYSDSEPSYQLVYQWVDRRTSINKAQQMYQYMHQYSGSPSDIKALVFELAKVITPNISASPTLVTTSQPFSTNNEANQDFAKGLQSFQTDNIELARHYFAAAFIRDPTFRQARLHQAKAEYHLGNWPASQSLYRSLLSEPAGALGHTAQTGLAQMAIAQGDFRTAEQQLQAVLQSTEATSDIPMQVEALWLLADLRVKQGLWQQQQRLLTRAKLLSESVDNNALHYRALYHLGNLDSPGDNQGRRVTELQQALVYFRRWQNVRGEAATLLALGTKAQFTVQQRTEYQLSALEKYRQLHDKVGEGWALMSLGWVYLQQFDADTAENYLQQAVTLHQGMTATSNLALDRFYLGFAALDKGSRRNGHIDTSQLMLARTTLTQAIKQFKQLGMPERVPIGHLLLATIDIDEDKFAAAEAQINLIENEAMAGQQQQMKALGQIVRAFIHIRQNHWQQALDLLTPLRTMLGDYSVLLHYLARCHYQLGDYQQAVDLTQTLKKVVADKWHGSDQQRLQLYRNAVKNRQTIPMLEEANPYLLLIAYVF